MEEVLEAGDDGAGSLLDEREDALHDARRHIYHAPVAVRARLAGFRAQIASDSARTAHMETHASYIFSTLLAVTLNLTRSIVVIMAV